MQVRRLHPPQLTATDARIEAYFEPRVRGQDAATFDFPIYLSLADRLGVVEPVVWDKDILKKDYLGEVAVLLDDWFDEREFGFACHSISTEACIPAAFLP